MSTELKESDGEGDARISYIENLTDIILRLREGLWDAMMENKKHQSMIKDFLNTPKTRLLLIYPDSNFQLAASTEFLKEPLPFNCMYFLKQADIVIPSTDFRTHMMHGNLTNCPLAQYEVLYEQIVTPILRNPNNNKKWPEYVKDDIVQHVNDFRKTISYCVGQAHGKIILPIPDVAKQVEFLNLNDINKESTGDANVRLILDSIGDMVLNWTLSITEVLEIVSSEDLSTMNDSDPLTDVFFWENRKENLEFIYSQVEAPLIKKMAFVLEKCHSCYRHAFAKMLVNIVEALSEAQDIANHLRNLSDVFLNFQSCEFSEMMNVIPKLMIKVSTTWSNSRYFKSVPSRIAQLTIKICNKIIYKICMFLNGEELFHNNRSESEKHIHQAVDILNTFIVSYYNCRNNMISVFQYEKAYPWEFPDDRVFLQLRNFLRRLGEIQNLFNVADTYKKIPSLNIFGIQHVELKHKMDTVFKTFCQLHKVFEDSEYDILDMDNKIFDEHYAEFCEKIDDLDRELGAFINQGCVQCVPVEEAFKIIHIFDSITKRPLVRMEFKKCLPYLISHIRQELTLAKHMYEGNIKCLKITGFCIIYRNLHSIAGALLWVSEMKERFSSLMSSLDNVRQYFITPRDADLENQMYLELTELLTKYSLEIFFKWGKEVEESVNSMLNKPIFAKSIKGEVVINYDLQMPKIMNEVKVLLKTVHKIIPEEAIKLYQRYEEFRYINSILTSTVKWYNTFLKKLNPLEAPLIFAQLNTIKHYFKEGRKLKWNDNDLSRFVKEIFSYTKTVYEEVKKAEDNIDEVKAMLQVWTKRPMYIRAYPEAVVDFKIFVTKRVKEQYAYIKATTDKMQEKMNENLILFKCDPKSKEWLNYVKYLESIIEDGLKEAAQLSLQYILDNTDPADAKLAPFIEVLLTLNRDEGLLFDPPLGKQTGSLLNNIESAMDKIYEMGEQAYRMTNDSETYVKTLKNTETINAMKSMIIQHIIKGSDNANNIVKNFEIFDDVWIINIEDALEDFLLYGPVSEDDYDIKVSKSSDMFSYQPTEKEFMDEIHRLEYLYVQADEMPPVIDVESWLIIDNSIFKEEITLIIKNWIIVFKQKFLEKKCLGTFAEAKEEDIVE